MNYRSMREDFMEQFEISFMAAYGSVYRFAVEYKGEKDYERRLIMKVREQKHYMKGQLDLMSLTGVLSFPETQQKNEQIDVTFDAYRQFGIVLGMDGIVHKANLDNTLQIRDREAWEQAEEAIAIEKETKAEVKTQKASVPIR